MTGAAIKASSPGVPPAGFARRIHGGEASPGESDAHCKNPDAIGACCAAYVIVGVTKAGSVCLIFVNNQVRRSRWHMVRGVGEDGSYWTATS